MSRPLAVAIFDRREVDSSGDYVLLSVASDDGQENLHIDGEYAVYRRTDGPELEAIVRDLAAATVDVDVAGVQLRAREWVERHG